MKNPIEKLISEENLEQICSSSGILHRAVLAKSPLIYAFLQAVGLGLVVKGQNQKNLVNYFAEQSSFKNIQNHL
jgi:hypothetical protein